MAAPIDHRESNCSKKQPLPTKDQHPTEVPDPAASRQRRRIVLKASPPSDLIFRSAGFAEGFAVVPSQPEFIVSNKCLIEMSVHSRTGDTSGWRPTVLAHNPPQYWGFMSTPLQGDGDLGAVFMLRFLG